jgi:type I restriction enzyme S subunit
MTSELSSLCSYAKGKVSVDTLSKRNYVSTENMMPNKGGIVDAGALPSAQYTQQYIKDDILVSNIRPYFKKIWMADDDGGCSNDVLVFRADRGCDSTFLYYILANDAFFNYASATSKGTKMPRGDKTAIMQYKVPCFNYETQLRIGKLLRSIDDRIAVNKKINDNLYEIVNAYYTSLFKDVECEMTTIGNYAERIYSGGTPTTSNAAYWDGTFGWFSSGETRNRFVISTEKSITQTGIDNSSTKLASKHDIVMASAGQGFTRGQTSMLLIDTYVNQSVIVIHADRNILPYLFWNLANRYEELRAISDSSSIRGSLTTKMIAAFEIPCANNDVIQTFSGFAWAVIPQIENNLLENERLAALRDSLLPKLMTGEIDVSAIQL